MTIETLHIAGYDNGSALKITPARYTAEEVISLFEQLYHELDFTDELANMGIGGFHVFRRKKALKELRAISIAFWGVALEKSFPSEGKDFFTVFFERSSILNSKKRDAIALKECVSSYVELLSKKKDTDFLPIATHLAEILALNDDDMKRLRLKLSLTMRSLYTMIFQNLV